VSEQLARTWKAQEGGVNPAGAPEVWPVPKIHFDVQSFTGGKW